MHTLRARLGRATAVGMGIVLAGFSITLYLAVRAALWAQFDWALVAKARSLAALVEQDGDRVDFEAEADALQEFSPQPTAEYYQFRNSDGRTIARSASLGNGDLFRFDAPMGSPARWSLPLPDGRPGRYVALTFLPRVEDDNAAAGGEPKTITLTLAKDTVALDETLGTLRLLLVGCCVAAVLVSALLLSALVRRGLRPLDTVAREIAGIGTDDLAARVRADRVPGELTPVVDRLNGLLRRLETAFAREKAFTADVAHELRTPLSGLRTTLEVALSQPRESEQYREAIGRSLAISRQMQQMVDNLLELARADAGQLAVESEPVDLVSLLRECWETHAERAAARRLDVTWQVLDTCQIMSDAVKLRHVLTNVLENAVTHADEAGRVVIAMSASEGASHVELRIENSGSRVGEADAERVFDRFWRGDAARATDGVEHRCGLGLPLCRKLVTLLSGTIAVATSTGGLFAVTIRFQS